MATVDREFKTWIESLREANPHYFAGPRGESGAARIITDVAQLAFTAGRRAAALREQPEAVLATLAALDRDALDAANQRAAWTDQDAARAANEESFKARKALRALTAAQQQPVQEGGGEVGEVYGPKATSTMVALHRPLPPGTKLYAAPPSATVNVEGLARRIESYHWDVADKSVAAQFAAELRGLAQQPAQAAPGDDARDAARWRYINQPGFFRTTGYDQYGDSAGEISVGVQKSKLDSVNKSITGRGKTFIEAVDAAIAATPPGDDAAGGGHGR